MQTSKPSFRQLISIGLISAGLSAISTMSAQAQQYGVGYILIDDAPTQHSDLSQIIMTRINAQTIEQGVQQLLWGSGWRLAGMAAADPELFRLMQAPWPNSWHNLGPDRLDAILVAMGGSGWQLVVDPVNRLVSWEVSPAFRTDTGRLTPAFRGKDHD